MAELPKRPAEAGGPFAAAAHGQRPARAPVPVAEPVFVASPAEDVAEDVAKNNAAAGKGTGGGGRTEDSDYIYHKVAPGDTVQSLQLRYGVDLVALKRHNDFPGDAIHLLPTVRIPKLSSAERRPLRAVGKCDADGAPIDPKERAGLVLDVRDSTGLSRPEAQSYLAMCGWDVAAAVRNAKEDAEWARGQARRRR